MRRKLPESDWSLSDAEKQSFKDLYTALAPDGYGARHGWLFDEGAVLPPDFEADPSIEPLTELEDFNEMNNARQQIVVAVHSDGGAVALLEIVGSTSGPYNVGFSVGHALSLELVADFATEHLASESPALFEFARGLLWSYASRSGWIGLSEVLEKCRPSADASMIAQVYSASQPADRNLWRKLETENKAVQQAYWQGFKPYRAEPRDAETLEYVTEMLLSVGRGFEMLSLIAFQRFNTKFLVRILVRLSETVRERPPADLYNRSQRIRLGPYI